jgi:hypothetical protein
MEALFCKPVARSICIGTEILKMKNSVESYYIKHKIKLEKFQGRTINCLCVLKKDVYFVHHESNM